VITCGYVLQECNIEEIDEDEPSKSSKDSKKKVGDDSGKGSGLMFKITSKVQYKTVLKGNLFILFVQELQYKLVLQICGTLSFSVWVWSCGSYFEQWTIGKYL